MVTSAYRAAYAVAGALPGPFVDRAAALLGMAAMPVTPGRRFLCERNMRRALPADATELDVRRAVRRAYASYGRYWAESFRLPSLSEAALEAGMAYTGFEHVVDAVATGTGPILVVPHLGGWEWGGFWMTRLEQLPATTVVEAIEPPSLFEFFVAFRESLGMHVIPLGPSAGTEVVRGIRRADVVPLLSDRDIEGTGVEVEFFGERTTLPAGPATLALRTGARLLPAAFYFQGPGHHVVVEPPVLAERGGRLRSDVQRITQDLAHALEGLIRRAPEQWHLMQPNWPSDHDAMAARSGSPG